MPIIKIIRNRRQIAYFLHIWLLDIPTTMLFKYLWIKTKTNTIKIKIVAHIWYELYQFPILSYGIMQLHGATMKIHPSKYLV